MAVALIYMWKILRGGGKIRIRQDFNGSYGLYLYKYDQYFAISNSFFLLLDHIKNGYPISLNRDYANQLLVVSLCNHANSETAINEIRVLERDAIVNINAATGELWFEHVDYKGCSLSLDSAEGIAALDHWYKKWVTVFRKLKSRTNQISIDLSGGFDSRISFLLMLKSGIDLNEINVKSIHDNLHTHSEDFMIASEIAEHYGFTLNHVKFSTRALHYSLSDIINIVFYTKMTFHKEMYYVHQKFEQKRFVVTGSGGESIREHWDENFIPMMKQRGSRYSGAIAKEMSDSVGRIFQNTYLEIDARYGVKDKELAEYMSYLYRAGRCRAHFGKAAVENYFSNTCTLTPLLDPDLASLKLTVRECQDANLLMALMYERYCPELLNFRFDGKRSINEETIAFARILNEKYPFDETGFPVKETESFKAIITDQSVSDVLDNGKNNERIPNGVPDQYLKSVFDSCGCRKIFATYFDEEIYSFAENSARTSNYHPLRECYGIIGLTEVIKDVIVNNQDGRLSRISSLDWLICRNDYEPDDFAKLLLQWGNFITARIDLKLDGESADFELAEISDSRAKITKPMWLQKNGIGYVIEADRQSLSVKLNIKTDGTLRVKLLGRDVRDKADNRIPFLIDYQHLKYNGREELETEKTAWHDKPIVFSYQVKAGDIISLQMDWAPYWGSIDSPGFDRRCEREEKIQATNKKIEEIEALIEDLKKQLHESI